MRTIILITMLLVSSSIMGQTQDEIDEAFRTGNYAKAIELTNRRDSIATDLKHKQSRCNNLVKDAQWYYNRKLYKSASDNAQKALSLCPNDTHAKEMLDKSNAGRQEHGNGSILRRFQIGVAGGADFMTQNFGMHIGASIKYGFYADKFNISLGIEHHWHYSYKHEYAITESGRDKLGTQLAIPIVVRYNFAPATNASRFYIGAGIEQAFTLTTKDKYEGELYPINCNAMVKKSLAGLVQVGIAMRHVDVSIYYKGYFDEFIQAPYYRCQENHRAGVKLAYYL